MNEKSVNNVQENLERNQVDNNKEREINVNRRRRVYEIIWKGKVDKVKDEGVIRLFAANYNGLRHCSLSKIEEIEEDRKKR